MKVWFKRVLITLVVGLIVAVIGLGIFLLTFDPNAYKSKLEELVYNRYHRTLSINGNIELSLFPRIGLSVQNVSLSDRDSEETFASIESARFAVAIWPLLFNRFVVDHVTVTGLKAWIDRDETGEFNFNDLLERQPVSLGGFAPAVMSAAPLAIASAAEPSVADAQPENTGTELQIDIAGFAMKEGQIHFYDKITGASTRVEKLDINTGRMTFNQAFDVALKGELVGDFPAIDAHIEGQALVKLDPYARAYSAQKLNVSVVGKLGLLQARSAVLRGDLAYNDFSNMLRANGLELLLQGDVTGDQPIKGLEASLTVPLLKADRSQAELQVERMAYRIRGEHGDGTFEAAFDAPRLAISPETAKGEPIAGNLRWTRPDRVFGMRFGMNGISGNASKLQFKEVKVDTQHQVGGRVVQVQMSSPANWSVFGESGGLTAMKGDVRIEHAQLPDGSFEFPFIGSLHADLIKDKLDSTINAVINGGDVNFTMGLTELQDPKAKFSLVAEALDLNTMFPVPEQKQPPVAAAEAPAAPAPPPEPPRQQVKAPPARFDVDFLRRGNIQGEVRIGELQMREMHATDVGAQVMVNGGLFSIEDLRANLYDGELAGRLSAGPDNTFETELTFTDVNVGPLLRDLTGEYRLSGRGSMAVDLTTQGHTVPALEAGLTGKLRLAVHDGRVQGIDLLQTLREVNDVVRNVFSGQLPPVVSKFDLQRQTEFDQLSLDLAFERGQGKVERLQANSPYLSVREGTPAMIDLVNEQLDVMVLARVHPSDDHPSTAFTALNRVSVPIRISGSLNKPGYQVQWKDIRSRDVREAVRGGLLDLLSNQPRPAEQAADTPKPSNPVRSIGDALKGLLSP